MIAKVLLRAPRNCGLSRHLTRIDLGHCRLGRIDCFGPALRHRLHTEWTVAEVSAPFLMAAFRFSHRGTCDICESRVTFKANHRWFRDHLVCNVCQSIPRERALMRVIKQFHPNFAELCIHESSPVPRGVSERLARECPEYSASFLRQDMALGTVDERTGVRCENLECMTFADAAFDLFITQDVLEHVFDPKAAFREIARVLKPGGAHIFTVPLVNGAKASERRATRSPSGEIEHHHEPVYHGDPVNPEGALMTMNWGYDLAALITSETGMPTLIVQIDDLDGGIRAELIEVVVSFMRSVGLDG